MENLIFSELNVSQDILRGIERMGFVEATPVQSMSIPEILKGNDVTAQAPTGTGKTCAFGIPMVEYMDTNTEFIQGLVLCPTRELVMQTAEELANVAMYKRGLKIVPIYGGQQIDRQILSLKRRPQIIVATPGRLMDHLRRRTIKLENLKMIVLDEADEMLNMGFREDIDTILQTVPEERQTVLFSATLSRDILDVAQKYQHHAHMVKVTKKEVTVSTIKQYYLEVKPRNRVDVLTRLMDTNTHKLSLVFCNTKRKVDELTSELLSRGYAVDSLHGDMKQLQRDRVMKRFKKGLVTMLIATDVAARGIDIEDIEAVYNFDVPMDEEYYVHRIGRTGRAQREGVSYTFVAGKEIYKLRDIMKYTKAKIQLMPAPSMADVENVRVQEVLKKAEMILAMGGIKSYAGQIDAYIRESEYTKEELCAVLLKMAIEGNGIGTPKSGAEPMAIEKREKTHTNDPYIESEMTGAEMGMVRMFLSIGKLDRVTAGKISEILYRLGLESEAIGKIDIYDKYSFIEVAFDYADHVIAKLDGTNYKGRNLSVEKAQKKAGPGKRVRRPSRR